VTATLQRRAGRLIGPFVGVAGAVAIGAATLALARADPGGAFGGASTQVGLAELAGGWSLCTVAALVAGRRARWSGGLFYVAGLMWFAREWSNPAVRSSWLFAAGLVLFAAPVPLVAHAVLTHVGRRPRVDRAVIAIAYVVFVLLLGLLPVFVFDPKAEGCSVCPANALLIRGDGAAYAGLTRWSLRLGLAVALVLAVVFISRAAEIRQTSRAVPILLAASAYVLAVATEFAHGLRQGVLGNDTAADRAWKIEAVALVLVLSAIGWERLRARRARTGVAGLVVQLADAGRAGRLRDGLAHTLGDESLKLAYTRTDGRHIDEAGEPLELELQPGEVATPLREGDTDVAVVVHAKRMRDDPDVLAAALSAARLALTSERLHAEVRAQLVDLRRSRARIVEAADAARERLERDLHDGAQQRIISVALALQLARAALEGDDRERGGRLLDAAKARLDDALDSLRDIAHGLYPAVLSDEGLAAALEMLAERGAPPFAIVNSLDGRSPDTVEATAYFAVAEAVDGAAAAAVALSRGNGALVVEVDRDGSPLPNHRLQEIVDRVGALGGRVALEDGLLRAEIPCVS
jgi:signal transduction histidine kinase